MLGNFCKKLRILDLVFISYAQVHKLSRICLSAETETQKWNSLTIIIIKSTSEVNTKVVLNFLCYMPTKFQPYWMYITGVMC